MLSFNLLQITATTAAAVTDTLNKSAVQTPALPASVIEPVKVEDSLSLFDLIVKGGYIMIPIGILLFIAIYVLIERVIALSKASRTDKNFMNTIKDFIVNGNMNAALTLCKGSTSPQAAVVGKGLSRIGKPVSEIKLAMEDAGRAELYKVEKNMIVLNIIGRIAPMFGFVGTIVGVVKIFYDISLAGGDIKIDTISAGLYEKMITSAGGLIVGIIAFASYHILNIVIEKIIHRMESSAAELLDILNEPSK
ncbi:MAG: MotA/TolQ/ExbB proton channel family protein [Bacteroidia bacterium]|nr:MotA/TolQ/ExbB proton channel family protein [Bacteroidia bacterium]